MYTMNSLPNKGVNQYLNNELMNASPEQLIMKVYDFAILNCQKKNLVKTNEALQVLITALNLDDPRAREIAIGFLKIYTYCQKQVRKRKFDEVQKILEDLRLTWTTALKNR
jgi:flagellar secretion chaperone FliS